MSPGSFSSSQRDQTLEMLLSRERVLSLLYAKVGPRKSMVGFVECGVSVILLLALPSAETDAVPALTPDRYERVMMGDLLLRYMNTGKITMVFHKQRCSREHRTAPSSTDHPSIKTPLLGLTSCSCLRIEKVPCLQGLNKVYTGLFRLGKLLRPFFLCC